MQCPKCSSQKVRHDGRRKIYSDEVEFEFFRCEECHSEFIENLDVDGPKTERKIPSREEILKKIRWEHEIENTRQEKINELINRKAFSTPPIYTELLEAINSDQASETDYEIILTEQPEFTVRLLDLVNHPLFRTESVIDSVPQLVTEMEPEALSLWTLATEITHIYSPPSKLPFSLKNFWKHSIACGLAAWSIGSFLQERELHRFFLAGLLHDIGRLIIISKSLETSQEIQIQCETTGTLLFEMENEILGYNHARVSADLLKQWHLPNPIIQGILNHHTPAQDTKHILFSSTLHVADIISYDLNFGDSGQGIVPSPDKSTIQYLGMTRSLISKIKEEVQQNCEPLIGLLI